MKQTIEYYYNLQIDDLFIEKDVYHFIVAKKDYYFLPFFHDEKLLKEIISYIQLLKEKKINCHDIIPNIKNELLTKIDEVNYLLMQVYNKDEILTIFDMIEMYRKIGVTFKNYVNNWAGLWSKKIDYIEDQLSEINVDNVISLSINYYIGLAENSIYYVNIINERYLQDDACLCHKRVYYPNTRLNYLNPLSFIADIEVRDIGEYLKSMFWEKEDAYGELQAYLKSKKLSPYAYNMLFARLLYPSYYFDGYERVVNSNEKSELLIKYISRADEYEDFLKKAYKELSLYTQLLNIEWLIY